MSLMYGGRKLEIEKGNGAEIYDSNGKRYIDFVCGHGSSLFGHTHPVLVDALKEAAERPWSTGIGFSSSKREEFMGKLKELMPEGKAFLCNSGTESIEAALKLVMVFNPKRKKIVALRRAFHGRTLGSLSLTFNPQYRKPWRSRLQEVVHVNPEDIKDVVDEETAAVFVEPVQGESGVHVMEEEHVRMINESCHNAGAMLVCDEIQTGWGRCGSILASDVLGLEPDMVCLAKGVAGGLPVGVTLWKGEYGDFPVNGHGTTYGGNPLVSAVGLAAMDLLGSEKYPEQATDKGEYLRKKLSAINSPLIKEVRGVGLLNGIELTVKAAGVVKALQERGVLALTASPLVLRLLPPFVTTEEQIDEVAETVEKVLEDYSE